MKSSTEKSQPGEQRPGAQPAAAAPAPATGSNPVPPLDAELQAIIERELLDRVGSPEDLKQLSEDQLPQLCDELRSFLLETVLATGGHLGSNLGVVEMTVALHYVFDFSRDRLVLDTSHQSYPHKVLTGRRGGFAQLRRTGGLCGFTNPEESDYDLFHVGHAGTSIATAAGLALAASYQQPRPDVIAVIGDSSLSAGVAFEGLNWAGARGEKLIVVLNDNEWSISKSVGALARYLSRIRSNRTLQRAQQEIHNLVASIPVIGGKVERTLEQVREVLRHTIVSGHVFEELGTTYVGPIDGHDVELLVKKLRRVRELDGVVLLHTLTQKGKGHPDAPTHPERVHATKPAAKPESEKIAVQPCDVVPAGPAYTKAFADSLTALAEADLRVHAITAGMPSGTGLLGFADKFPNRFHDVGITEQHGVAMAAGMAKGGLRPVCAIYSTFLQRGYDQVFQEVALQNLPVVFAMDRAGLVGQDGPTHNGVFDIAYLRTLPNFTLCAPRDATDMRRMLELSLTLPGPTGLRYPRASCPGAELFNEHDREPMRPGLSEELIEGDDVCIWAYGDLVNHALEAAEALARDGHKVGVVDARFAKPLDEQRLSAHLKSHRFLLCAEEHQKAGGFGTAVLEFASAEFGGTSVPIAGIKLAGIPDAFQDHCTERSEQLERCGIDAASLERSVRQLLGAAKA